MFEWLSEDMHRGTERAMLVSALGGLVGGYGAGIGMFWLGAIACAGLQVAALWVHPGSETIAIQYREYQRLTEGDRDG